MKFRWRVYASFYVRATHTAPYYCSSFSISLRLHIVVQLYNNNSIYYEYNVCAYIVFALLLVISYIVSLFRFCRFHFFRPPVFIIGKPFRGYDIQAGRRCAHNQWPYYTGGRRINEWITSPRFCEIFSIFSNTCSCVWFVVAKVLYVCILR